MSKEIYQVLMNYNIVYGYQMWVFHVIDIAPSWRIEQYVQILNTVLTSRILTFDLV